MPLISSDNVLQMIKDLGAGLTGTYTPNGGAAIPDTYLIFNNPYNAAILFDVEVENTNPWAVCRASDITGTINRGRFLISGVNYWIAGDAEPDAEGFITLPLSEVDPES